MVGTISFVPAGREYLHWQEPRTPTRFIFIYFDPAKLQVRDLDTPRVLFEDALLLAASLRLGELVEYPAPSGQQYLEALGFVVLHELERLHDQPSDLKQQIRGGLAAWQQRIVLAFIDEHLAEPVSLAHLAQLD
jgi:AraC family transcriptional regulator